MRPASDEYLDRQKQVHAPRVHRFLLPIVRRLEPQSILDVGCGAGLMVQELQKLGYTAHGADLAYCADTWREVGLPPDRFHVIQPDRLQLPFPDGGFDFVYSIGVIEHVGTSNGHSDRLENYREIRRQWMEEVFRVTRTGGHVLIGCPNKGFPIDTHGPDSRASGLEKWLHKKIRLSVHKTWGENFLLSYSDMRELLPQSARSMEPLSIANYYNLTKNTPKIFRPVFRAFIDNIPRTLLGTGLNPWMLALVSKG